MGISKLMEGRHALITGASRGIGKAIAISFAEEEVAKECKMKGAPSVTTHSVDLLQNKSVDELCEKLSGKIDVLVNNAGMVDTGSVLEGDADKWDKLIQINLHTLLRLTRGLVPSMVGKPNHSHIINIDSIAGRQPWPNAAAYAATKWALSGFSLSIFEELKDKKINVTCVYPGWVATDMTSFSSFPQEKMIMPKDVAQAALLPFRMTPNACPTEIVIDNTVKVPS